eukprot:gene25180-30412_t
MHVEVLGWNADASSPSVRPLNGTKPCELGVYHNFALIRYSDGTVDSFSSLDFPNCPWLSHCIDQVKSTETCKSIHFAEAFLIVVCHDDSLYVVKPFIEKSVLGRSVSVNAVACGMKHCLVLANQRAFVYGHGEEGQLGLGPDLLHAEQLVTMPISSVRCVAANAYHSAIVTEPYGELYTFGSNAYARLGISDTDSTVAYTPMLVDALGGLGRLLSNGKSTGVRYVDCGLWHTVVIADETCDVMGWGWNNFGQLGKGRKEEVVEHPRNIVDELGDTAYVRAYCGNRFTALLTESKELYMMGEVGAGFIPGLCHDKSAISGNAEGHNLLHFVHAFSAERKRKLALENNMEESTPVISKYTWGLAYLKDNN